MLNKKKKMYGNVLKEEKHLKYHFFIKIYDTSNSNQNYY